MKDDQFLRDLQRPQYVATPDALLSALAWLGHTWPGRDEGGTMRGLMYKSERKSGKKVRVLATYPETPAQTESFIKDFRPDSALDRGDLAEAVAHSVLGIRAEKSAQHPAAPLTLHLALLQDLRGFLGTANPPNLGAILEQLYALGVPAGSSQVGPAERWLEAVTTRTQADVVLQALDRGAHRLLPPDVERTTLAKVTGRGIPEVRSPMTWFADKWPQLMGPEWTDALPIRVWVDWCCTVLRMALGFGYLWEASWYELFARARLGNQPHDPTSIASRIPTLVPWVASDAQVGVRDVASALKSRVKRGDAVRGVLGRSAEPSDDDLREALTSPGTAGNNAWEAIRYALKCRDQAGPYADHYGLLRARGTRYLVVEPGPEWVAVIASLATGGPGRTTDARQVMDDLYALGLRPELRDLVLQLELAGMANGSADADYGLEVRSAY